MPIPVLRSPKGFAILPIHHSHDPAKDAAWYANERKKYDKQADWDREQEIDFSATAGTKAYPNFRQALHLSPEPLLTIPTLPLCLCADFNVDPHVWVVGQHRHALARALRTLRGAPASITDMVRDFRLIWPRHPAGVWVYGDATGRYRDVQTVQTDYDLLLEAFRGYPSPVMLKVPVDNPRPKDRINAVNRKLLNAEGESQTLIDPEGCPDLVQDFLEVVMDPKGDNVLKVRDRDDPYAARTHASDAWGYYVAQEWPVVDVVFEEKAKPLPPRQYGRLLGSMP